MTAPLELNLLGKDYFDEGEAAHYACVSLAQFRNKAAEYGITAVRFMGKKVYRRTDIQRAIENEYQISPTGKTTMETRKRPRTREMLGMEPTDKTGEVRQIKSERKDDASSSLRVVAPERPNTQGDVCLPLMR